MTVEHYPVVAPDAVGWLTGEQMVEVDRVMMEDLRIDLTRMMENAGRNLAAVAIDRFAPATVLVLAGSGGNGGGGLVAARHLANRGVDVTVILSSPARRFGGVPAHQLDIVRRMGLAVVEGAIPVDRRFDLVLDAMVGYSLRGRPRGAVAELIEAVGSFAPAVLSLDTPSGLDVTSGHEPGPVVRAAATMTLALPKTGLRSSPAVGELYVADISVPPAVYGPLGVGPPPRFADGPVVRVADSPF